MSGIAVAVLIGLSAFMVQAQAKDMEPTSGSFALCDMKLERCIPVLGMTYGEDPGQLRLKRQTGIFIGRDNYGDITNSANGNGHPIPTTRWRRQVSVGGNNNGGIINSGNNNYNNHSNKKFCIGSICG